MTFPAYATLRAVGPGASVLLADNPGPMTLEGTNTWLLGADPARAAIVVDPGPSGAHLDRVVAATESIELVVLTHHHLDHSEGAAELARRVGAEVRAADKELRTGPAGLDDGDVITAAGVELRVLHTPGHTPDSVSLLLSPAPGAVPTAVLTGDTVLGRGTTVIAEDGSLADYLDSLRRLAGLGDVAVLPGHGPERDDVAALAKEYLAHRADRLTQIRAALRALGRQPGPDAVAAVVDYVYADVDDSVRQAAAWSVRAQLDYLAREQAGRRVSGRDAPSAPGRG